MTLANDLLHRISSAALSDNDRAKLRCELSKQLQESGDDEGARNAMGEFWLGIGRRPELEGLNLNFRGEVLLRLGALTTQIGSSAQVQGTQEAAKDLLSESISIFESLANNARIAEAQIELAVCYWRLGEMDEARVVLQEAINGIDDNDYDLKAHALLRSATFEGSARRYYEALRIYSTTARLVDKSSNPTLRGKFHHLFGTLLKKLNDSEDRADYADRALIEFAAASIYFEEAGFKRHQACVENNQGFLLGVLGRVQEAHDHLDRAQMLFTQLKDNVHLAQVDETRARVLLAEGRLVEAEKTVRAAVRILEQGDESSLLTEALTTHGITQARLKHPEQAKLTLARAIDTAERAGDLECAGNAALVMVEELSGFLNNDELKLTVDRARELLANSQDLAALKRLSTCASKVIFMLQDRPGMPRSVDWNNFYLKRVVLGYEAHFITLALDASNGVVTRAARLLGFNHHQSLLSLLNARHKKLRDRETKPIVARRRSIMKVPHQPPPSHAPVASDNGHPENQQ